MVSFEYNANQERIVILLDKKGAENLIKTIKCLVNENVNEHTHLFSTEWGGNELDIINEKKSIDDISVNHVVIYYCPNNED